MPPTWESCPDSQIKCNVDKVCYDSYYEYCMVCLNLTQEECVCRNEVGIYYDGESCKVATGDDTYYDGECISGECVE